MVKGRDAVSRDKKQLVADGVEIAHLATRRKRYVAERCGQKSVIHRATSIAYAIITPEKVLSLTPSKRFIASAKPCRIVISTEHRERRDLRIPLEAP